MTRSYSSGVAGAGILARLLIRTTYGAFLHPCRMVWILGCNYVRILQIWLNLKQAEGALGALGWQLSGSEQAALEEAAARVPKPCFNTYSRQTDQLVAVSLL